MARVQPEVIGVSVRNIDDQSILTQRFLLEPVRALIAACKHSSRAPVVVGGAGYSMYPGAALRYLGADYGVCGEGERALGQLLTALAHGQDPADVPGVWSRDRAPRQPRQLVADLDDFPLAADELWAGVDPADAEVWIPVQTCRGCALDCLYCSTAQIEGRSLRGRSPQRVVEYLARARQAGFRRFYFTDNTFNLPVSYALALCRAIAAARLGIEWRAILYPHDAPEELIAAMAEAGCVEASLGFESGSQRMLAILNKRFTTGEVRTISDRLKAHRIRRTGFLLLGGPGETRDSAQESLDFADSLGLETLSVTAGLRIYPDTPLARIAAQDGLIASDDDLLLPRFYLRPELETWLREVAASRQM